MAPLHFLIGIVSIGLALHLVSAEHVMGLRRAADQALVPGQRLLRWAEVRGTQWHDTIQRKLPPRHAVE